MKNRLIKLLYATTLMALITSCSKQLDLTPVSSISDANYWQTPDQFDAFVTGIHARFRTDNLSMQYLGEMRADIFGTDPGNNGASFTGEATQGLEHMWLQTLDLDNALVNNYGGFYYNIDQINLLISKIKSTNVITGTNKSYYLGEAYGMRAFYYFQMYRSWGNLVIQTDPVTSINVGNLNKPADSSEQVMKLIKADIDSSATSFASDYSFRNTKSFWSKPATLMLKAEVYLWTSYRGGGANDATTALNALDEIQNNTALSLLPSYASVFATDNKGNNEIIFASRYKLNEATLGFVQNSFVPQTGFIANYYDSLNSRKFTVTTDNWGGLLRAPVKTSTYRMFNDRDSRKWSSIQGAYNFTGTDYTIAGCFSNKYQGEQNAGNRQMTNDFPVYRYADLLLLKAEAKIALGQSPATEINLVRARAYGTNFNAAVDGYPNQTIDANPREAILQERLFEFVFEGKRWYDLRRMGDNFVYEHTTLQPSQSYKLLWPIDRNSLINNRLLTQTPGYTTF
ncbi:SusD family outer membrane lipoprotein NanU [Danxiaibacter flavus]|uniref:SusD family outer membrane lipoprotein NanU n=1 Tax=Danxiaibacter flavus TaxID=3049108 RepID=A0ABV3ZC59_9BACT|nr:SusD family outer membrane lipoprotein NanU [Chitinophagaceae bacterium DXS]